MIAALRPNHSVTSSVWSAIMAAWAGLIFGAWVLSSVYMVPPPLQVLSALGRAVTGDGLIYELWTSMKVNVLSLVLSTAISMTLSYLTQVAAMKPAAFIVSKLRFVSLAGLVAVFTMAFGGGFSLKVALLTFGETVFMVTSMASVVANIQRSEFDQARTLRMGEWRTVWEVVILGTAEEAFEVVKQNAAMGWAMLTMVEGLVRSGGGVGVMMIDYGKHFQLDVVFADLFAVSVLGASSDAFISWLQGVVCPYSRLTKERS